MLNLLGMEKADVGCLLRSNPKWLACYQRIVMTISPIPTSFFGVKMGINSMEMAKEDISAWSAFPQSYLHEDMFPHGKPKLGWQRAPDNSNEAFKQSSILRKFPSQVFGTW